MRPFTSLHRASRLGVAAGVMVIAACARAPIAVTPEPIVTDRPDMTESIALVPRGMVQIEGGATTSRVDGERTDSWGETLVRIGALPRLELRIEAATWSSTRSASGGVSERGLEDAALGIKTPLYRRAEGARKLVPDVSLLAASSLPTGARVFRGEGAEPEAKLATEWEIADRVGLATNLITRRGLENGSHYWEHGASASLGFDLTERVGSYVEWYGTRDMRTPSVVNVGNGGLTYGVTRDFQLDARVGRGLNGRARETFVGIGLARRW